MAVIAPCVYENGQLKAPDLIPKLDAVMRLDEKNAKFFPTFDIGYTHVFRITIFALSYQDAEAKIARRKAGFFRKMNQVEGFTVLDEQTRGGFVPVNKNYSFSWDIYYAVENTGTRTQRSDSPYPEYWQDRSKLSFAPETASVLFGG